MSEEASTLVEMMFRAEQICIQVEKVINPSMKGDQRDQIRLKISQCRGFLALIQAIFEEGEFSIENSVVRGNFRYLIMARLWTTFYAREIISCKVFRMVVNVEASFTYLLNCRGQPGVEGLSS